MENFFRFRGISYTFEPGSRSIEASGELGAGEALAIRGPSGAGKSTVLRILARLLRPCSGEVVFKDRDWHSYPPTIWRRSVHYVPQKPVMFAGTVMDNLRLPFELAVQGGRRLDQETAVRLLAATGLSPDIARQDAQTLSGGEMARLALVRSILAEPQVLLLDEPTAFLDEAAGQLVYSVLLEWLQEGPAERGIIIVSHREEDLKFFPDLKAVDIRAVGEEGFR